MIFARVESWKLEVRVAILSGVRNKPSDHVIRRGMGPICPILQFKILDANGVPFITCALCGTNSSKQFIQMRWLIMRHMTHHD